MPDESLAIQEEPEEDNADEQNDEQEVRYPGRPASCDCVLTLSSDLLPEGYDPLYDACHERGGRDNLSQVQ